MAAELVPDALWSLIRPLLPASMPKPRGGRPRVSDRACLTGIRTPTWHSLADAGERRTFTPAPFRDLVYYAKLRAPICFNPVASRTVLPLQELRARLGMQGKTPDQIAEGVQAAYAKGELPIYTSPPKTQGLELTRA
jgi:hypothetical protein